MKHEVRREWICPQCQRVDWSAGDVVQMACPCGAKQSPHQQIWMKLVEPRRMRRPAYPKTETSPEIPAPIESGTEAASPPASPADLAR